MRCEGCGVGLRAVERHIGGAAEPMKRPPVGLTSYVCDNDQCDRFGLTVQRDGSTDPSNAPRARSWRKRRALRS